MILPVHLFRSLLVRSRPAPLQKPKKAYADLYMLGWKQPRRSHFIQRYRHFIRPYANHCIQWYLPEKTHGVDWVLKSSFFSVIPTTSSSVFSVIYCNVGFGL